MLLKPDNCHIFFKINVKKNEECFMDITRFWKIFTIGLELDSKGHLRSVILASKHGQTKCTFPFFYRAKYISFILWLKLLSKTTCQISAKSTEWSGRRIFESYRLSHLIKPLSGRKKGKIFTFNSLYVKTVLENSLGFFALLWNYIPTVYVT